MMSFIYGAYAASTLIIIVYLTGFLIMRSWRQHKAMKGLKQLEEDFIKSMDVYNRAVAVAEELEPEVQSCIIKFKLSQTLDEGLPYLTRLDELQRQVFEVMGKTMPREASIWERLRRHDPTYAEIIPKAEELGIVDPVYY